MDVTLERIKAEDKPVLERLMELYLYEFSQFSGDDLDEDGRYGYRYLDAYWTEAGRFPYLIRADGKIAGFALVCPYCHYRQEADARSIGEFFIMLKYRGQGAGASAAAQVFDLHPGLWEVTFWNNNRPARAFWTKIITRYTNGDYTLCGTEKDREQGFLFNNGG